MAKGLQKIRFCRALTKKAPIKLPKRPAIKFVKPIKPPITYRKRKTELWGGVTAYSDCSTIDWNSVLLQATLVAAPVKVGGYTAAFTWGIPNQPITFYIYRENGSLYKSIPKTTDLHGYCSHVEHNLPIDTSLHPDMGPWELYTFKAEFKGTRYYASSSWEQEMWVTNQTSPCQ